MKLIFIGVGEAFEPQNGNTSTLICSETKLLIDCGYAIPYYYLQNNFDPNYLDAIYLTHFHADHTFGLINLLSRFAFDQRSKPLTIIGQPGTEAFVKNLYQLGDPSILDLYKYPLKFQETVSPITFNELSLSFAPTVHPVKNYAIKIKTDCHCLTVTGDGIMTDDLKKLLLGSETIIAHTQQLDAKHPVHNTIEEFCEYLPLITSLKNVAFVHLSRKENKIKIQEYLSKFDKINFIVPIPNQVFELD